MTTLIVGATGKTGRLLVHHLLNRGEAVKVIVRSPDALSEAVRNHSDLTIIQGNILDFDTATLARYVQGCSAVASCLGHNATIKGLFGPPRKLVSDATRQLCTAIKANTPVQPVKFVLMNTAGNRNHNLDEPISAAQKVAVGLVRLLVPPHADNEQAADYLRVAIGSSDPLIEWAAVRPDTLVDLDAVTDYEVHPSPTRSAIFNPGKTSRINVGHFMADLITNSDTWNTWKGQMPVIYNRA